MNYMQSKLQWKTGQLLCYTSPRPLYTIVPLLVLISIAPERVKKGKA